MTIVMRNNRRNTFSLRKPRNFIVSIGVTVHQKKKISVTALIIFFRVIGIPQESYAAIPDG